MAPSASLFYILFTIGFLSKHSTGLSHLELGVHFIDEPTDVTGVKGKSLSIPCKLRTTRQKDLFEIVWYHDSKVMDLRNDKRRTIFQNGTLHFSKLVHKRMGHTDQGEYRCVAVGENGSLSSKPGFLRISGSPENFSRHPTSQNVEAGSNVRLICEIDSQSDIEIAWEKDNGKLPYNPKKYATVTGSDIRGSILYIFNAVPEDSGSYRCTARNVFSNRQRHSSSGVITVLPQDYGSDFKPLTFLSAQEDFPSYSTNVREISESDDVTLDCVVNGYPVPILSWTFAEHGQNTSKSIFNSTNEGHNIIHIQNVTRHQAGTYICSAIDLSDKKSKTQLKVKIAPEILEKSESIVFRTSKTVRFRCIAYGNPVPEMHWLKDGNVFNITGRIKQRTSINDSLQVRVSELIVSSTVASDAGIYQCMAKNSVGWSWAASRLLLNATKPAPEAPERVLCEPISSSQIRLTWDAPNTSTEIKAFSIHYHLTDNGEEMQKVMPSDSRFIQIDKLLPFSNYTFYLRLYMDSASEFSEKAVCQTDEEVPTDAPEKKLQILSSNSVHVSWTPLAKEKARGVISRYKIQWRFTKSPSSKVVEVAGNMFNYTITGLTSGKTYDVRVLAATSKGWPDSDLPWETFEIPLNFNSSIASPPEVILQPLNSTGIEIRWNSNFHLNKGTKLIGYKIFYRKQNSSQVGPIIVPADTNKYVLGGLEPRTWYEIKVMGFTPEDDGEIGASFMHTLSSIGSANKLPTDFSSIPEPPISLEADPVSPVTINLTWSSPQTPSGFTNIKHYTVCFSTVRRSHNKNSEINCVKSLENKISVSGLNPYTLYQFKVRAHDFNDKQSGFSQAVECHTLEGVPSQVVDISWKAINKTSVQVSWKEPRHRNGILKSYSLFYTQDSNLPLEFWNVKMVSAGYCETQITDLTSNVKYYLVVRASTSAGLGTYASPKQLIIPLRHTVKNKQNDHYIGIIVGLGIGICCIILCTVCILCRRKCLKRNISQEFEITSGRRNNGSTCQRDRKVARESRETEYFTFLSSRREQPNALEVALRHLDAKENFTNGTANGIRMSLLSESKISHSGQEKADISVTENPRCNRKLFESSIRNEKKQSSTSKRNSDFRNLKYHGNYSYGLNTPLLSDRRKFIETELSQISSNSDTNGKICSEVRGNSPPSSKRDFTHSDRVFANESGAPDGETIPQEKSHNSEQLSEDEWSNINSILRNPDFRFSNVKASVESQIKNSYKSQSYLCNGMKKSGEIGENGILKYPLECGIYKNPKLSLHFTSKEVTQKS